MVQGVDLSQPFRGIIEGKADTLVGLAGGIFGVKSEGSADAISRISLVVGFLAPLVKVFGHIRGWNVKVLIDCGSTGNYISDSLIPALGMEVIPEKD